MQNYYKKPEKERHMYELIPFQEPSLMYIDIDCPLNKFKFDNFFIRNVKKITKKYISHFLQYHDQRRRGNCRTSIK